VPRPRTLQHQIRDDPEVNDGEHSLGLLTWRCSLSLTLLASFKRRQGRSTAGLSIGGRSHGSLTVVCAAYRGDITLDGSFQNLFPACRNDTIEIMAIDRIELKRLQRDGNSNNARSLGFR
jgi:hypothetical protein